VCFPKRWADLPVHEHKHFKKSIMKKLIFVAVLLTSTQLVAQDGGGNETWLGKGKLVSTGYGALSTQYTRLNEKSAVFTGAYGGWMINHKFMIGLAGYGLATNHQGFDAMGEADKQNELKMGYGGLMLEYTFLSEKKIHATTSLLVGAGAVVSGYRSDNVDSYGDHFHSVGESDFSVLQPTVSVEANMTDWFRISLGAGYRFVNGSDLAGLCDKRLSAPTMSLSLKFGKF
jgi:hypothetical protein